MLRLFSFGSGARLTMRTSQDAPLVICGHGMVAQRLIERLVALGHPFNGIVVFNAEPFSAYNRIQLSAFLANDMPEADLALKPRSWFARHKVTVFNHEPVTGISTDQGTVITAAGRVQPYSKLVLATGSRPSSLGIRGEDLEGVSSFRDLADTRALIKTASLHKRAVVIGGGFLGLEAAEGLRARGMAVTVLHRSDYLLNRQLDKTAGELLKGLLAQRGLNILTGQSPAALLGKDRVTAIQLQDDTVLSTDLVVIATGITPNIDLALDAGLQCDKGICVDGRMRTSHPAVYALGECCQFGSHTFGLVEPGFQQAQVLAQHLCQPSEATEFSPGAIATRLKISGIPIFSCGRVQSGPATEDIQWHDRPEHRYGRLLIEQGQLVGAVFMGDTANGHWYADLIDSGQDISGYRDTIAFGQPYCEASA